MKPYVALFRGINVGKSTRIAMRDLATLFTNAGCADVKTYVQSGNVVFRATHEVAAPLPKTLERQVRERFGVSTWILLRSLDEMRETVANNPFAELQAPPTSVAVAFHAEAIDLASFAHIAAIPDIPDRFEIRGKDLYLYLPKGFSGSKFPQAFFNKDLARSTTRNWRTVTKVLELMEAIA
jgi:uncharacterized protein (DUF1697 family)